MIADKRSENFASFKSALSITVAPLQYAVNWPSKTMGQLKVVLSTHDHLVKENLQLKTDQLLLKAQVQRLIALESENAYLKALQQSSRQINRKTLIAELLAVDIDPFVNQIILNKGQREGVYLGQPVLDANGVMGQVSQVGPLTSRVILINDPHSGLAVQNARNGIRAVAVGDMYSGKMRLTYLPKTVDIKIGDIFITSGLGGRYPQGYPVGKVTSVIKDPAHQFATVYLEPSAHLDSSRQVLLVWYQQHA